MSVNINFKNTDQQNRTVENLSELIKEIPDLPKVVKKLNDNHIRYGLYVGSCVSILTSSRKTTDIDTLIADEDLNRVLELFPKATVKKGKPISEGVFIYPNKDEKIELLAEATITIGGGRYPNRLTDLAWEHAFEIVTMEDISVKMLNPVDTILLKAMLQRGAEENKHDLEDIEALVKTVYLDKDYIYKRSQEMQIDDRVINVLKKYELLN